MNWYSLRVMSGKENKVKDTIFRELDFEKDLKAFKSFSKSSSLKIVSFTLFSLPDITLRLYQFISTLS